MPTLLLIRHGENNFVKQSRLAGRLPGVHLNARGRAQVAALAAALERTKLAAVYTSPLDRCVETAQVIAAAQDLRPLKRADLAETKLGDWEGKRIAALRRDKRWRDLQERPASFRFPGGESMLEQQARLVSEVQTCCAQHKAKDAIAVVSHGDPIKLIITYYLGLSLDHFQRLHVDTASMSTLVIGDGAARLLRLNWTVPFEEK
jgi:probable phosphoglycerate mutase